MKPFLSTLILICISIAVYAQSKIDVLHYKYHIELNDNNDTIYGKAEITVKFLEPSLGVRFDLDNTKESKGMKVSNITGVNISSLNYQFNKVRIGFDEVIKANDTLTITINYKGIPSDGLIISKNKYNKRTFFSDNWPNRAHNWIPV